MPRWPSRASGARRPGVCSRASAASSPAAGATKVPFRPRPGRGHGTVTIKVTGYTRLERVTFATLRAGAKHIEATVRRSNGRWLATHVERSGGGGHHDDTGDDH